MSLPEKAIKFKEIEKEIHQKCYELGRKALREVLSELDAQLMNRRDKCSYRHVGRKSTTLKTILGEVSYERAQYENIDSFGRKSYVFLLDKAIGLEGTGQYSDLLTELVVEACCTNSYREAARLVSKMTGQSLSHTAAWSLTQLVGKHVDAQEQRLAEMASNPEVGGIGGIETKVLFEEQDGIHLSMQGKSRKAHGKRKELKVAIAYDGVEKKGSKRYELTNKVACASFESVSKFFRRKEGIVSGTYNVDEIIMRFLNGDGAPWIRYSQTDETVHFQLDPYHRNNAITRYVSNPDVADTIRKLLYSEDLELLLHVIEVELNSTEDKTQRENYQGLLAYFTNNQDGLLPYYRRGLDIPVPPDGKEYRRMGCMESNIFTIIGNRMKGRRACWSVTGGENLARLLCLKHTGRLRDALARLSATVLAEHYSEEIISGMSSAKSPEREGKGYNGFHQSLIPSSLKWLKNLAAVRPVYNF